MELSRRAILFFAAGALAASIYYKGRAPSGTGGGAVFFPHSSHHLSVKVTGKVSKPGVYHVRNGTTAGELIKLTVPERTPVTVSATLLETPVKNGDHLEVGPEGPVILKKMKGAEKMLLGIPLDPDQMELEDWGSLPGIGPKTALKIVEDRKLHGPFRNIEGVRRVPGIGDKKFDMIKKYF